MGASRNIRFLASVRGEAEAQLAFANGADIIDCKEPAAGALGALPHAVVAAIKAALPAHVPVSATVGDLPCSPEVLTVAAQSMAATGVDFVKVGLFPGGDDAVSIAALGRTPIGNSRLVAVLLADQQPGWHLLPPLADAGFAGVMLDTADKAGGALTAYVSEIEIANFVAAARHNGLLAGLAGSLRLEHAAQLSALEPDIMGFRGALCAGSQRKGALDPLSVRAVARALRQPPQSAALPEALAS